MKTEIDNANVSSVAVLVLMSTYDGEKYLREQLDSIYLQRGVRSSLLVRDDGSSDSTVNILQSYSAEHNDFDMIIIQGDNKGYIDSFSELIKHAYSEPRYKDYKYFAFCDQDDVWLPDKMSAAVGMLSAIEDSMPNLYCSNATLVDSKLVEIGTLHDPLKVVITRGNAILQNWATGCTAVFNRKAAQYYIESSGGHVSGYKYPHDFMMYRICIFLGNVSYDPTSHILYRQHGGNQIGKPVNMTAKVRKKLRHYRLWRKGAVQRSCGDFINSYADTLSAESRALLDKVVNYRNSVKNRNSLLKEKEIRYDSASKNLILKIKILLGVL